MKPKRKFIVDLKVDRSEVDQFGFVDLRAAFVNGIIPSDVGVVDSSFNGVAAPAVLLPHAQDVFESMRQANYVQSVLRSKAAASKEREKLAEQVAEQASVTE